MGAAALRATQEGAEYRFAGAGKVQSSATWFHVKQADADRLVLFHVKQTAPRARLPYFVN